ncbi:hypothetical protein THASP1DRAFT_23045 [Thamnocephalis sphaerospora]|uniref:Uncharacterized protein n=1 Tax=Thamnocephalis sphaerospora TaxID=78915 RepID=A0A4P9XUG6_9FUNG|nr:hypothetical protein THASP1DRAFT_23045 [Thamnocephalis sphaerospora]|eukprot:RKP09080.1 hypothetical protein THASP1DRAFT_23045 [Thamnocephalis sphaerospora]
MSLFRDDTLLSMSHSVKNSVLVAMLTVMFWICVSNCREGASLLYARRHTRGARLYLPMLNIVPSLVGGFANCTVILALDAAALALGASSIVAILFTRVYYAWMRHKWLLYLGSALIFVNFSVSIAILSAMPVDTDKNGTCSIPMNTYWTFAKFIVDIVTNLVLSGLYLYVLGRMVSSSSSVSLYRELRHEGFLYTFLVIVSSVATSVVVILDLLPGHALYVYGVDVLLTLMFWIFFGNLCDGLLLLHSRRHTRGTRLYVPILNIIPNLFCAIMCACSVIMKLDTVALSFGTTAIIGILFIRVYYAWMRHRWLLYLGSVMLFINFSVCISSLVAVTPYIDSNGSCLETIDHYWTLAKFSTDIIVNVTLSGLYLYVLGQAFRAGFSTSLYRELRQEGFIATFLVIISSTTAAVFVIIDIAPGNALYVYGIDTPFIFGVLDFICHYWRRLKCYCCPHAWTTAVSTVEYYS